MTSDIELETEQPFFVQFARTVKNDFTDCEEIVQKHGDISVRLIVKELHVTHEKAAKMINRYQSILRAKEMHKRPGNVV